MKSMISAVALIVSTLAYARPVFRSNDPLADTTQALAAEITERGLAYDNLVELTDIGSRLPGSEGAERAIQWAAAKLRSYGLDHVTLQPMQTPIWTRGEVESAVIVDEDGQRSLRITALGGSVGTPKEGIEAEVIEVHSLAEVERLGPDSVRGKIVFYNRPMDPNLSDPFEAYAGAYDQRSRGARTAARYGAVATLVRSLTPRPNDEHPHTGHVVYAADVSKIPAAAVSTKDANVLSARLQSNPHLRVRLVLSSQPHGMGISYNVYGDIAGSERPDEIVVVGAHLDSWDLGVGAHDDGSGVVQALETVRVIQALGLKPKRTIRVVLFMTEEMGAYGAYAYADMVKQTGLRHVAAIESDRGGFAPVGFSTDAGPDAEAKLKSWSRYLAPLGAGSVMSGESGVDVEPLRELGATTVGFVPDSSRYFDYHHAETDQLEAVDKDDLHAGAAAIAALTWLFAEDVP